MAEKVGIAMGSGVNQDRIEAVEHLNVMLDELYDWADTNRLWLGL